MGLTSQLMDSAYSQPTSSHQRQITVPEFYPPTPTLNDQYSNSQSRDRLLPLQSTLAWPEGDLSLSYTSPPPASLPQPQRQHLRQPQLTAPPPNADHGVLYSTQFSQLPPQNYPGSSQRRQQKQHSPSRPTHNQDLGPGRSPYLPQHQASPRIPDEVKPLNPTQYNQLSPPSRPTHNQDLGPGRSPYLPQQHVSPRIPEGVKPQSPIQYNQLSPPSTQYSGTPSFEYDNHPQARQLTPAQNRQDGPPRNLRTTESVVGEEMHSEWEHNSRYTPSVLSMSLYMCA